jgi:hypothetical protein
MRSEPAERLRSRLSGAVAEIVRPARSVRELVRTVFVWVDALAMITACGTMIVVALILVTR